MKTTLSKLRHVLIDGAFLALTLALIFDSESVKTWRIAALVFAAVGFGWRCMAHAWQQRSDEWHAIADRQHAVFVEMHGHQAEMNELIEKIKARQDREAGARP